MISNISTDNNLLCTVLNVDYKKVQWEKPPPNPKWDIKNLNKKVYNKHLMANKEASAEIMKIRILSLIYLGTPLTVLI